MGRHQRPAHLGVATEPATELERVLTQVWAQALNIESIGATDNFFELGGDSLVGMQVSRRLREVLDRSVPVRLLFRHPTARALAAALDRAVPEPDEAGATLVRAVRLTVDEIRAGRR